MKPAIPSIISTNEQPASVAAFRKIDATEPIFSSFVVALANSGAKSLVKDGLEGSSLSQRGRKEVVDGGILYAQRKKKKKWKPELGVGTNRRLLHPLLSGDQSILPLSIDGR
ncbi:unnamed protein product [Linum trigynum]|uniref:Uncharacterized protein n=1 Tax=Linum trigynum TaxID=586398 RepID=A0AAV2FQJ9_9ROSI